MAALESLLVIKAVDETAKAFAEVQKRIASIEEAAARLEKVFGAMSRVTNEESLFRGLAQREEIDAAVSNMERLVKLTEEAAAAQRTLAQSAKSAGAALAAEGRGVSPRQMAPGVSPRQLAPSGGGGHRQSGHRSGGIPLMMEGAGELLPFLAAMEAAEIAKKTVENAAELEQNRFRIRELSRHDPSEAPLADSLAAEVAKKYPGITTSKALDNYLELRANSVDAGGRVDPVVARRNMMAAGTAQNAALALGFEMTPADMQSLLKGVEGSGRANDPKAVEKITDAYIRAKQVFGSAIAASMIRDYTANAKSANFSIGDDQFYLGNMVRMSEGNASRLGNEVNQTLATMVGGHMTKATGAWMVAHGLARPDQIVKTGPGTVSISGEGLKDAATLQTNQNLWAATTLRKAIEDSGAVSDDKVAARVKMLSAEVLKRDPKAEIDQRFMRERAEEGLIAAELAKTGMRSSVTDNLAHLIGNERLIERDTKALQNASGKDAGNRLGENPVAAFSELSSAISNFGTALASPGVAAAGPMMDSLAKGIASLTAQVPAFYAAMGKILGGDKLPMGPGIVGADDFNQRLEQAYRHQADMHPAMPFVGRDMENARAGALSRLLEGGHAEPAAPQQVNVSGEADIRTTITVTASSELISVVDAARNISKQVALNPVQGGHSGRMDSDASPLRHGGSYNP